MPKKLTSLRKGKPGEWYQDDSIGGYYDDDGRYISYGPSAIW